MKIEVRLFASLRDYLPHDGRATSTVLNLGEGSDLRTVIAELKIPRELAQLVMIDGIHATDLDTKLEDGQVVSIFPPVAGG